MRNFVVMILLLASTSVFAGESSWKSFNDGMAEAKRSNKKILVDVYTDWCGWCKKMDAQTYENAKVAKYLSDRYVLVKLNAESGKKLSYQGKQYTEQELAGAFGVTGYPTTLFLKPNGEAITVYPGFADAENFRLIISYIAEDHYLTKKFDEYTAATK
ncbi:MAG: DUF255 domain-containing protein [bacterium]